MTTQTFKLSSPAFQDADEIPKIYTCNGENRSPPLRWENTPEGTKSFVLIMEDSDAPGGTWDHWILFNIPAKVLSLEENIQDHFPGFHIGRNSWGHNNYGGPCPPDKRHRYFFKLYALNATLSVTTGASKTEILASMKEHILGKAVLMGTYLQPGRHSF